MHNCVHAVSDMHAYLGVDEHLCAWTDDHFPMYMAISVCAPMQPCAHRGPYIYAALHAHMCSAVCACLDGAGARFTSIYGCLSVRRLELEVHCTGMHPCMHLCSHGCRLCVCETAPECESSAKIVCVGGMSPPGSFGFVAHACVLVPRCHRHINVSLSLGVFICAGGWGYPFLHPLTSLCICA